jgi:RNA polymerase sigma-70 factor (ECF subfamily)
MQITAAGSELLQGNENVTIEQNTMKLNAVAPGKETRTDIELARAIEEQDWNALRLLMRRHNQMLYRTARSILKDDAEAEDALQEAYVRAYQRISGYRGAAKLSTWLVRIVVNESLAMLRKRKRSARLITIDNASTCEPMAELADRSKAPIDGPEAAAMRADARRLLENAIDALPPQMRVVFMLRAVEDMTVDEAAATLDIPAATVRTRLFRARALLREALGQDIDFTAEDAFAFAGERCDRIVAAVLARVAEGGAPGLPMLLASRAGI